MEGLNWFNCFVLSCRKWYFDTCMYVLPIIQLPRRNAMVLDHFEVMLNQWQAYPNHQSALKLSRGIANRSTCVTGYHNSWDLRSQHSKLEYLSSITDSTAASTLWQKRCRLTNFSRLVRQDKDDLRLVPAPGHRRFTVSRWESAIQVNGLG